MSTRLQGTSKRGRRGAGMLAVVALTTLHCATAEDEVDLDRGEDFSVSGSSSNGGAAAPVAGMDNRSGAGGRPVIGGAGNPAGGATGSAGKPGSAGGAGVGGRSAAGGGGGVSAGGGGSSGRTGASDAAGMAGRAGAMGAGGAMGTGGNSGSCKSCPAPAKCLCCDGSCFCTVTCSSDDDCADASGINPLFDRCSSASPENICTPDGACG